MGKIRDILSERRIGRTGMYADHARLELMENIHFHWRDLRIVMSPKDFLSLHKMVNDAEKAFRNCGSPQTCDWFNVLAEENLEDAGYHNTRFGVEDEADGNIHTHYRDLRVHLKPADFLIQAQQMWFAYLQYSKDNAVEIDLQDLEYHEVVDTYMRWLREDPELSDTPTDDELSVQYLVEIKHHGTHAGKDVARPNGLPEWFPNSLPEGLDREHLRNLYMSLVKHGYACGPYEYQYLRVYKQKDGSLYAKDSHRLACLKVLGCTKIMALVVDKESGWRE